MSKEIKPGMTFYGPKSRDGVSPGPEEREPKMLTKEEVSFLEETIEQVKVTHKWMVEYIKARIDMLGNPGNYSDELNLAIEVQKILDII